MNEGGKYDTYWSNTSGNGFINLLIQQGNPGIKQIMEDLLQGKSFEAKIDEKIVFDQLNGSADAVWSLLLATGYLKVLNVRILVQHFFDTHILSSPFLTCIFPVERFSC